MPRPCCFAPAVAPRVRRSPLLQRCGHATRVLLVVAVCWGESSPRWALPTRLVGGVWGARRGQSSWGAGEVPWQPRAVRSAPCPGCSVSGGGSGRSVLPAVLLVAAKRRVAGQSSTWQIYLPELQGARELVGCSQRCNTGTVATSRCHRQQQSSVLPSSAVVGAPRGGSARAPDSPCLGGALVVPFLISIAQN